MSAPAAAFFDLDRTLVSVASPKIFQRHLSAAGFGTPVDGTLADLAFKVFELVGESAIVGRSAKLAPRAAVGWPVDAVIAAARPAAAEIAGHVSDFARASSPCIAMRDAPRARHHHSGAPCSALADLLGMDDVIATRWTQADGAFTGRVDGDVVWGPARRDAVLRWCTEHDVDPAGCWAYSDSYYDSPSSTSSAMPSPSTPMSAWPPPPPSTAGRSVRSTSPTACRPWVASNSRTCSVRSCGPNSSQRRRHRLGPRIHPREAAQSSSATTAATSTRP